MSLDSSRRNRNLKSLLVVAAALLVPLHGALAATPGEGTVSEATPLVTWNGDLRTPTGSATCLGPDDPACDNFKLSIVAPATAFVVEIRLTPIGVEDWDLQIYGPDGSVVDDSGNSPGQAEIVVLGNPAAGTYTVAAAPFAGVVGYTAEAEIRLDDSDPPPPGAGPTYSLHVDPVGRGSGEPNLGINWLSEEDDNGGTIMDIVGLQTLRVRFDDCTSPPRLRETDSEGEPTWVDVSPGSHVESLDPIIFTDPVTGRTFSSQLLGKTSAMEFTDDDGESWTLCQGSGINSGVDHQTVGGGPFAEPLTGGTGVYSNAVYYCSQDLALAQCAVSLTGCTTFGPAVPIYDLTQCGGVHGHAKVAPNGTVYVPNKNCEGQQAVVRSKDNGTTWTVLPVPGTVAAGLIRDPSVGVASDGTLYIGIGNGDGKALVAVSHDEGDSWSPPIDVGAPFGIQSTVFPSMVAGDPDRAAFAFLGSKTGNATGDDPSSPVDWHLYVSTTYDGGLTWTTVDATPGDPVQRGTICDEGFGIGACANGTRNLLDFMDVQVDVRGRPVVSFADGCIGSICVDQGVNTLANLASLARLKGGRGLFSAYDEPDGPPDAPLTRAVADGDDAVVTWSVPDDNGGGIDGYTLYRETDFEPATAIASLPPSVRRFVDDQVNLANNPRYEARAFNDFGESLVKPGCDNLAVVETPDPEPEETVCVEPGLTIFTDAAGDATGAPSNDPLDIRRLWIAEPSQDGGPDKLVLTLKVADLSIVPQQARWTTFFRRSTSPNATEYFVAMTTGSVGTIGFVYGHTFIDPTNGLRTLQTDGSADAESGFSADGTIRIVVSNDKFTFDINGGTVAPPEAGETVVGINSITQQQLGVLLATIDDTVSGIHTLEGNASCDGGNGAPLAVDDMATTPADTPVVIDVLANDSDPENDPLSITGLSAASHGEAVVVTDAGGQRVRYSPDAGFIGADSFGYTITDGQGNTASGDVEVTVTDPGGNNPPQAGDDAATVKTGESVLIEILANDDDPDGDSLTVVDIGQGSDGSVNLNADQSATYAPDDGFVGDDEFTYQVSDGRGGLDSATVSVTVTESECREPGITVLTDPQGDHNATTGSSHHDIRSVSLFEAAEDADGDGTTDQKLFGILEVDEFPEPLPGNSIWRVAWRAPNATVYFFGMSTDETGLTVELEYGYLDTTTGQNIFRTVGAADPGSGFDPGGRIRLINSLAKWDAIDVDGDGSSDATGMGAGALLTQVEAEVDLLLGAAGTGLLQVIDDTSQSAYQMVGNDACADQNEAPVAIDDAFTTGVDTAAAFDVLANDSDPDGDLVFIDSVQTTTDQGGVAVADDGGTTGDPSDDRVLYDPPTGFVGTDTFTYSATDGSLDDTATVTVAVSDDGGCHAIDDSDPAIEYRGGWHLREDAQASNGGYHRRMGSNQSGNASTPTARVVFEGDEVTYYYVMSDRGGTADVWVDGAFVDTVVYGPGQNGPENQTFGHELTYSGFGPGGHELVLEHRTGAVYVDGFAFACESQGADPTAPDFASETETEQASSSEGPVIERSLAVGADVVEVSAVVEGALVPLALQLIDAEGVVVATGGSLLGGPASGFDAAPSPGVYTLLVANPPGAFDAIEISIARTTALPSGQ